MEDFSPDTFAADLDSIIGGDDGPKKKRVDQSQVQSILDRMRGSTRQQESGGARDPQRVQNPRTHATGYFQVLPENIPAWTQRYYKQRLSVGDYQNNPEAQTAVFNGEMGRYLTKALTRAPDEDTAIRMAAAAWYGGEGAMHRYDSTWRPRPDEPSFQEYTNGVLSRTKGQNPVRDGFADFLKGLDKIVPAPDPVETFKRGLDAAQTNPALDQFTQGLDNAINPEQAPVIPTTTTTTPQPTPVIDVPRATNGKPFAVPGQTAEQPVTVPDGTEQVPEQVAPANVPMRPMATSPIPPTAQTTPVLAKTDPTKLFKGKTRVSPKVKGHQPSVSVSLNPEDFQVAEQFVPGGEKVMDIARQQTPQVQRPRVQGKPNEDLRGTAGEYTPTNVKDAEEAARQSITAVGRMYGITPQEVDAYFVRRRAAGTPPTTGTYQPGQAMRVPFSVLAEIKGEDAVKTDIRQEQSEARPGLVTPKDLAPVPYDFAKTTAEDINKATGDSSLGGLMGPLIALPGELSGLTAGTLKLANEFIRGAVNAPQSEYNPTSGAVNEILTNAGSNKKVVRDATIDNLKQFYEGSQEIMSKTGAFDEEGRPTTTTQIFRIVGSTPKIAIVSAFPGGMIGGFALEGAAISDLQDGSKTDIAKAAAKGALQGAIFKAFPAIIGKQLGEASNLIKAGIEVPAIGLGSYTVGKIFNDPDEENLVNSAAIAVFHGMGALKGGLKGKIIHARDAKGNEAYLKVDDNKLVTTEPQDANIELAVPNIPMPDETLKPLVPAEVPKKKPIETASTAPTGTSDLGSKDEATVPEPDNTQKPAARAEAKTLGTSTAPSQEQGSEIKVGDRVTLDGYKDGTVTGEAKDKYGEYWLVRDDNSRSDGVQWPKQNVTKLTEQKTENVPDSNESLEARALRTLDVPLPAELMNVHDERIRPIINAFRGIDGRDALGPDVPIKDAVNAEIRKMYEYNISLNKPREAAQKVIELAQSYDDAQRQIAERRQKDEAQTTPEPPVAEKQSESPKESALQSAQVEDYKGEHAAPGPEDAPLHDVTKGGDIYPEDFYGPNGLRYYGTGDDVPDRESYSAITSVRNRPNAKIRIYRAIPHEASIDDRIATLEKQRRAFMRRGNVPEDSQFQNGSAWYNWSEGELTRLQNEPRNKAAKPSINEGDWVTLSRAYAKDHGESALNGKYKIISKVVPVKTLFTNGDSLNEFGYWPEASQTKSRPSEPSVSNVGEQKPDLYHNNRPAIILDEPRKGMVKIQYLDGKKETPTVSKKSVRNVGVESNVPDLVGARGPGEGPTGTNPKRLTKPQAYNADYSEIEQRIADTAKNLKPGDTAYISPQLKGSNGRLIITTGMPKRAGLESVEGKPNNYRKPVEAPEPKSEQEVRAAEKLPELTDNYVKPLSHYTKKLYRETNPAKAVELLSGNSKDDNPYFANTPNLAKGQGINKGVLIELDSEGLRGQVNQSKPGWELAYKNGEAEFVGKYNNDYRSNVQSITISKDVLPKSERLYRALNGDPNFTKTENADGSITFKRNVAPSKVETRDAATSSATEASKKTSTATFKPGDQVQWTTPQGIRRKGTVEGKDGELTVVPDGTRTHLPISEDMSKTPAQVKADKIAAKQAKKSFTNPDDLKVGDFAASESKAGKVYSRGGQLRVKYEVDGKIKSEPLNDSWKKTANPEAGAIDPTLLTLGLNKTLSDDVVPGAKKIGRGLLDAADDIKKLVFAGGRGEAARLAATSMRAETGKMARSAAVAEHALKEARKYFSKNPVDDNYDFIANVEAGDISTLPPQEQAAGKALRQLLDDARERVRALGTGKLEAYIENYFPHIWEDPKKAAGIFGKMLSKRPLEGSKSFLKKRVYNTFQEGLDAGLTPVSDNPVDLALLKIRDMDKYVAAHRTLAYLKKQGLAQFVRLGQKPPDGFIKIDDRIAEVKYATDKGELVTAGHIYAAEPAATIINNYLSPGLSGSKYAIIRDGFKAWRYMGNLMNQAQLGFSGFHAMFTTLDAVTSKLALGINELASGQPLKALRTVGELPVSPITNLIRGDRIYREGLTPNSTDAYSQAMANWVAQAGGRFKMDEFYHTKASQKMMDAFRRGNILGGLVRTPAAGLEIASKPLMEYLVPRQKLGVFADLMRHELERLGPDATLEQQREAASRVWDTVDNRMGQMVYDNLFWNKMVKDLSMASVRSVGWNLGDIRELGGAVKDVITLPARVKRAAREGKAVEPILTYRMAYAMALPFIAGSVGATIQYLYTGKGPTELKDYFSPKTGNTDENGNPERLSLPTYMKDIYAYAKHPGKTLQHKMHPLIALTAEMLTNKDYYGTEIRNADDPIVQQLKDVAEHIGKGVTPFSVQGVLKEKERQGTVTSKLLPFFGFTPAPKDIDNTKAEDLLSEIQASHREVGTRTKAQAEKSKEIADLVRLKKKGLTEEFDTEFKKAQAAGIVTREDLRNIMHRSSHTYLETGIKKLELSDALDVYEVATDAERTKIADEMKVKIANARRAGKVTEAVDKRLKDLSLKP